MAASDLPREWMDVEHDPTLPGEDLRTTDADEGTIIYDPDADESGVWMMGTTVDVEEMV